MISIQLQLPDAVDSRGVILLLNELLKLDPGAIDAMVETRVPVVPAVGEHPTVQVQRRTDGTDHLGILGVLNGLFPAYQGPNDAFKGWGPIVQLKDLENANMPKQFVHLDDYMNYVVNGAELPPIA